MAAKKFQPDAGKAAIYIYRNETYGAALKMPVALDGVLIGDTASKTYLVRQVSPGEHTVISKTENDAKLPIIARAGQSYFVWQEVKMGMFAARSDLHLVDEATGRAGVQECKLIQ